MSYLEDLKAQLAFLKEKQDKEKEYASTESAIILSSQILDVSKEINRLESTAPAISPYILFGRYLENEYLQCRNPKNWNTLNSVKVVVRESLGLNSIRDMNRNQLDVAKALADEIYKIINRENQITFESR